MKPATVTAAALLIVLAVGAGAKLHSSRLHPPPAVAVPAGEASPVATVDQSAQFDPPAGTAPSIPERLPEFSLSDLAGKPRSITAWRGKSLVLNFWATWCAPCRREIPLLETISADWAEHGIEVVGIAVDHRNSVQSYAAELKIPYVLLVGEEDALDVVAQLGVESPAFPFTVFTDRRGEVVTLYMGELHKPQADLILTVVQNVNEDRVDLAAARRTIVEQLHSLPPAFSTG